MSSQGKLKLSIGHRHGDGEKKDVNSKSKKLTPDRTKSVPRNLTLLHEEEEDATSKNTLSPSQKPAKKKFSFARLLNKVSSKSELQHTHSNASLPKRASTLSLASQESDHKLTEEEHREAELQMIFNIIQCPQDMGLDADQGELEGEQGIQLRDPYLSAEGEALNKLLENIDVINGRVTMLEALSGTAIVAGEHKAVTFLEHAVQRMRSKQKISLREAQNKLNYLIDKPECFIKKSSNGRVRSSKKESVVFKVSDDFDTDTSIMRSHDDFNDSDEDDPAPEAVVRLAQQIRKEEGYRFKHMSRTRHGESSSPSLEVGVPPPPNPLAHSKKQLLRSHTSVPGGLCNQSDDTISTSGKRSTSIPFNLLTLSGQLSWLAAEYMERGSSTHRWAVDLIQYITRLSVTRATWLNIHQQLRQTTEQLYAHRGKARHFSSPKASVAWSQLQAKYLEFMPHQPQMQPSLLQLSALLERKFHLAFVCDIFLFKVQEIILATSTGSKHGSHLKDIYVGGARIDSTDSAQSKLNELKIRLLQLKLDAANGQNWTPAVTDWMTVWIQKKLQQSETNYHEYHVKANYFDCEMRYFGESVDHLGQLVDELAEMRVTDMSMIDMVCQREKEVDAMSGGPSSVRQAHHLHHPSGHYTHDLRPLDADRCAHKYSSLVRQIYEHTLDQRPLGYLAVHAFYEIAFELDCPINWRERLTSIKEELQGAWDVWRNFLQHFNNENM